MSAPTASANLDETDQTVAVSNIATISSPMVNETRGQFTNSNLKAPPSDLIGPAVSISGLRLSVRFPDRPRRALNQDG